MMAPRHRAAPTKRAPSLLRPQLCYRANLRGALVAVKVLYAREQRAAMKVRGRSSGSRCRPERPPR